MADRAEEWKNMLLRLYPLPEPARGKAADERPPHHILAVFTLIVCDEDAFNAFYGEHGSAGALFDLYPQLDRNALEPFLDTIGLLRQEFVIARFAWRTLAGDYTGTACPERASLEKLVDFTKTF
jgi:hypothetical protein